MSDTANYNWPKPRTPGASQIVEIQRVATALDQADAKAKEISDALAALNAAYDAHTHAFGDLTGKPSTVAGFGITDAYTKTEIDTKVANDIDAAINALINGSPGALDTLQELATAMGNDPNFATTVTNSLATKVSKSLNLSDIANKAAALANLGGLPLIGGTLTGTLSFNKTLSASNELQDWQQGYRLFSDNAGSLGTTRLWFDAPHNGEMHFGPRGGSNFLAYMRVRSERLQLTGEGGHIIDVTPTLFEWKGNKVWHAGNDGHGSGLDADQLDGMHADTLNTPNSVVARDGNGYIRGKLYHMEYAGVEADVAHFITQKTSDGWFRRSTPAQAAAALEPHLSLGNEVYSGSSTGNTNFPIGHTVVAIGLANRNAAATIYIPDSGSAVYTTAGGTALAGVWRCRGRSGQAEGADCGLFERVG